MRKLLWPVGERELKWQIFEMEILKMTLRDKEVKQGYG